LAYRVVYKESVHKDLKKFGKSEAKRIMDKLEKDLIKRPDSIPVLKGQFAGLRKYRFGDYRIIFVLLGEEVTILRIGNRKEAYKK